MATPYRRPLAETIQNQNLDALAKQKGKEAGGVFDDPLRAAAARSGVGKGITETGRFGETAIQTNATEPVISSPTLQDQVNAAKYGTNASDQATQGAARATDPNYTPGVYDAGGSGSYAQKGNVSSYTDEQGRTVYKDQDQLKRERDQAAQDKLNAENAYDATYKPSAATMAQLTANEVAGNQAAVQSSYQKATDKAQNNVTNTYNSRIGESPEGATTSTTQAVQPLLAQEVREQAARDPNYQRATAILTNNEQKLQAYYKGQAEAGVAGASEKYQNFVQEQKSIRDDQNTLLTNLYNTGALSGMSDKEIEDTFAYLPQTAVAGLAKQARQVEKERLEAKAQAADTEKWNRTTQGIAALQNLVATGVAIDPKTAQFYAQQTGLSMDRILAFNEDAIRIQKDKIMGDAEKAIALKQSALNLEQDAKGKIYEFEQAKSGLEQLYREDASPEIISMFKKAMGITDYDDPLIQAEIVIQTAKAKEAQYLAENLGKPPAYGTKEYWDLEKSKIEAGEARAKIAEITGTPVVGTPERELPRLQNTGNVANDLNNPGNLRPGGVGDEFAIGYVKVPQKGNPDSVFLVFRNAEDGAKAQEADIRAKVTGGSRYMTPSTSLDKMLDIYAGNPNAGYKNTVASTLGVDLNAQIGTLDPNALAGAIRKAEGFGQGNSLYESYGVVSSRKPKAETIQGVINLLGGAKLSDDEAKRIEAVVAKYPDASPTEIVGITAKAGLNFEPEQKPFVAAVDNILAGNAPIAKMSNIYAKIARGATGSAMQDLEAAALEEKIGQKEFANASESNRVIQAVDNVLTQMDKIEAGGRDIFGPFDGNVVKLKSKFVNDPEMIKLESDMNYLVAKWRNSIGGTAITQSEATFLAPVIASITDKEENARTKLESVRDNVLREYNATRRDSGLPELQNAQQAYDLNEKLALYMNTPVSASLDELWDTAPLPPSQEEVDDMNLYNQ
jgi:hypothetical protein